MKITAKELETLGACANQVALFRQHFGEEVEITEARCVKYAPEFNWRWIAARWLSAPAQRAYDEAMAPALRAYWEASARAFARAAAAERESKPC